MKNLVNLPLINPNRNNKPEETQIQIVPFNGEYIRVTNGAVKVLGSDKKSTQGTFPFTCIGSLKKQASPDGKYMIIIETLLRHTPFIAIVYSSVDTRDTVYNTIDKWWGN